MRLSPTTTGALMLSGGLANTSFVGLPMIETFYGRNGMAIGILIREVLNLTQKRNKRAQNRGFIRGMQTQHTTLGLPFELFR